MELCPSGRLYYGSRCEVCREGFSITQTTRGKRMLCKSPLHPVLIGRVRG